jgi:hypothetical protein
MRNANSTFRFRTPRKVPADSLSTVVVLSSLEELAAHLNAVLQVDPISADDLEIFPCHTDRNGWHNHMVSVKNRFIAGFTDRQVH